MSWSVAKRSTSFVVIVIAYAASIAAAIVVAATVGTDRGLLALSAGYAASVGVLYVVSQIFGNGSTFDAWWSVMPMVLAVWFATTSTTGVDARQVLVVALTALWGVRLTANWALSWPGLHHEDWRYRKLYADLPLPRWVVSLLTVHVFPLIVVTLGSFPFVAALTADGRSLAGLDVLAAVIVLTGVGLEHFADVELRRFNRRKSPGDVLDTGLWSRSRHPNYLGEMLWWIGLWLFAVAADPGAWWTGIGAVAMIVMFLTASIPMAEERSAERRPDWAAYAARTPMLVPRLRPRGDDRNTTS
jgi:steroid 5-alpha reductase family enzyme